MICVRIGIQWDEIFTIAFPRQAGKPDDQLFGDDEDLEPMANLSGGNSNISNMFLCSPLLQEMIPIDYVSNGFQPPTSKPFNFWGRQMSSLNGFISPVAWPPGTLYADG